MNLKQLWTSIIFLSLSCSVFTQNNTVDSTGHYGDNFSLQGALELFKKAKSPEDFERLLNTKDKYVNNLDLNEDGKVDYIRVEDNVDGNIHVIVMQVPINTKEAHDIAVIEIEKIGKDRAIFANHRR